MLTELFPNTLEGQKRRILWPIRTALGLEPEPDSHYFRGTGYSWVAGVIGAMSTIALLWAFAVLLRSVRAGRHLEADDELAFARAAARPRRGRLARVLRHAPGQDGRVLTRRPGRRHLPRRGRHQPRQRRPDRRPAVVAGGDRGVDGRGRRVRLGPRRARRQRAWRHRLPPRRAARHRPRRRGGDRCQRVPAQRRRHGAGASGGVTRAARRLPPRRAPPWRDPRRRDGHPGRARRALAR